MQDSKQIDELFRLMDDVCETGDAALPALEQYLQTQTDAPEIDVQASLKKFKADHKEFFVKPHRGRRLCYRIFVVAAAVFAASTAVALATGHNPFDYAAMWDSETFGFFQSGHDDFETTEDGYTHFPDGSSANYEENHAQEDDTVEYDPNAPLGSEANPEPEELLPMEGYENEPDTDLSGTGLEKTESSWDTSHTVEYFDITNADLKTTLEKFNIKQKMAPTAFPDGYSQVKITVWNDHMLDTLSFSADYSNGENELSVNIRDVSDFDGTHIEKDDRPIINYSAGGKEWYILHNLSVVDAVSMNDPYQIMIYGRITVDEAKQIVDSIYE